MNLSTECLGAAQVELLLQGNLTPHEHATAQEHLEVCEQCRRRIEETIGPEQWWGDIASSLNNHVATSLRDVHQRRANDRDYEGASLGETRLREKLLDLLGPTDDPNMLGRLGPYEIIGLLGQGGMGAVFKGFDRSLNRFVAIKMLLPHLAASGAARKRFAREGQAVAAVVDDHVMAIHCVDEWQGVPYLVMTYSRGVALQKRLSDNGPMEVREILRIGMQAAKGLAAAHAQGIVHRDIKPANIFLDQNVERVQLMDFGLARAVDDGSLTRSGTLAGTPQYMSPEQARAETLDHRSDLFSLGSVLYAMCTGHAPFRAESSYSVLRLITDREPRPIREINSEIPEWLCAIISKLMAKQAHDRFESAKDVAEVLEDCLAHVQQPTSVPLPKPLVPHAIGRRSIFKVTNKGVIAMLGTLGMTLLAMMLWQATEAPDISGHWTSDEWGTVVLEAKGKGPGEYEGTFSGSGKDNPAPLAVDSSGQLHLKWSRVERRFNGTWGKGAGRCGTMSLRMVDKEIRGGWTTDEERQLETGTPLVGDLLWKRRVVTVPDSGTVLLGDAHETVVEVAPGRNTKKRENPQDRRGISDIQNLPVASPEEIQTANSAEQFAKQHPQMYGRIAILKMKREELAAVLTSDHPTIRKLEKELAELEETRKSLITAEAKGLAIDQPLNRQNARAVVEAFVAAALAGEAETAKALATDLPSEYISRFKEILGDEKMTRLPIQSVFVNDLAKPTRALAISETVTYAQQPGSEKRLYMVLTLIMSSEGWSVFEVTHEDEVQDDRRKLKKFLELNPNAVRVAARAINDDAKPTTNLAEPKSAQQNQKPNEPMVAFAHPRRVLDVSQVMKEGRALNESEEVVVVRFRVANARPIKVGVDPSEDWWELSSEKAPWENHPLAFKVDVTTKALDEFTKNGVKDVAKHFVGKIIEVEGPIQMAKSHWIAEGRKFRHFITHVYKLEQIKEAKTVTPPVIDGAKTLNRENVRSVIEVYVAAALQGDYKTAASVAIVQGKPADPKQIEPQIQAITRSLNLKQLAMHSIHLNDCEHPTGALAISESVTHAEKHRNGEQTGFVMLELYKCDDGWFIIDIAFRTKEAADDHLKRFIDANPKSIDVPPGPDEEKISAFLKRSDTVSPPIVTVPIVSDTLSIKDFENVIGALIEADMLKLQ